MVKVKDGPLAGQEWPVKFGDDGELEQKRYPTNDGIVYVAKYKSRVPSANGVRYEGLYLAVEN
jgi:hypothetical protein